MILLLTVDSVKDSVKDVAATASGVDADFGDIDSVVVLDVSVVLVVLFMVACFEESSILSAIAEKNALSSDAKAAAIDAVNAADAAFAAAFFSIAAVASA